MSVLIIALVIIAILFFGILEYVDNDIYGPVKTGDIRISNWLDEGVRLNEYNKNIICKFPEDGGVEYLSRHKYSSGFRSNWCAKMVDGERFRIKKGSLLHDHLERKHQELLATRIDSDFSTLTQKYR